MATRNIQHIQRDGDYVPPSNMPYWLVVVSRDPALTAADMKRLAAQIAATPVLWIATWGCAALSWEDALDGEIETRMVEGTCPHPATTSSHDEAETLAEVVALVHDVARFEGGCEDDVHVLVIGATVDGIAGLLRDH